MYKKEDPRTIRTREMFKQGLLHLLQEGTTINSLTVQKVAKQAGLNRTTFYLHYQDIPDLVTKLTEEVLLELSGKIEVLMELQNSSEKNELIQLLEYLHINRQQLSVLFQMEQFEKQLFTLMKRLIETRREKIVKSPTKNYVAIDIKAASLVGIIIWWLRDGQQFSANYLADQIHMMYR